MFTKLAVLLTSVCLLLGALPLPASAAQLPPVAALARYIPDSAPIFVSLRTDDDFIDALDALLAHIGQKLPGALPVEFSLTDQLDQAVQDLTDGAGDFLTVIRPWLGDAAAIAFPTPQALMSTGMTGAPDVLIAVSVTNRAAAETFLGTVVPASQYDVQHEGVVTLFVSKTPGREPSFAVRDDVLLIGSSPRMLSRPPESTLGDSEDFNAALDLLPGDDYSALVYLNTPALTQSLAGMAMRGAGAEMAAMKMFLDAAGPQVIGFAIEDDLTLMMDTAQMVGDTGALEEAGLWVVPDLNPVDLSFAAYIPADAPLVMQGTDLGPMVIMEFKMLRALGDFIQAHPEWFIDPDDPDARMLAHFNLGHIVTFINLAFAGLTGLNLQEDVLAWMEGDYAVFLRILPDEALEYTADIGFVTETSNPGATELAINALGEATAAYEVERALEVVGEAIVLAMPGPIRALYPPEFPRETLYATDKLDFLVGGNANVAAMGTRAAVTFSLSPTDGGLAVTPAFVDAQKYLLDEAVMVWYLGVGPLRTLVEQKILKMQEAGQMIYDIQQIYSLLALFDSGTISGIMTDTGDTVARFALTLAP